MQKKIDEMYNFVILAGLVIDVYKRESVKCGIKNAIKEGIHKTDIWFLLAYTIQNCLSGVPLSSI